MNTKEKDKSPFQKWYGGNKETLNERRKKKYDTDPDYKQAVLDRQAEYRRTHPTPSRAGKARIKMVAGVPVESIRISEVAVIIGRSIDVIRYWEAKEYIPKPTIEAKHRFYTKRQVGLMKELADVIDVAKTEGAALLQAAIESKSSEIHLKWNN